jgi:hypothetical protein
LQEQYGSFGNPKVLTGGGGQHYYFRHPGGYVRSGAGKLGPGLDVKGDGGYVVAPPSEHKNGKTYRAGGGKVGTLPPELAERITVPERESSNGAGSTSVPPADWQRYWREGIPVGQRDEVLFRYAASLRRRHPNMEQWEAEANVAGMWAKAAQVRGDVYLISDAVAKVAEVWATYPPGAPVPEGEAGSEWEPQADESTGERKMLGGQFIFEGDDEEIAALWGKGSHVLWGRRRGAAAGRPARRGQVHVGTAGVVLRVGRHPP